MLQFILRFFLPALLAFAAALWCGSQKNMIFALFGFMGFFIAAAALLAEGWKQFRQGRS